MAVVAAALSSSLGLAGRLARVVWMLASGAAAVVLRVCRAVRALTSWLLQEETAFTTGAGMATPETKVAAKAMRGMNENCILIVSWSVIGEML